MREKEKIAILRLRKNKKIEENILENKNEKEKRRLLTENLQLLKLNEE